MYLHLVAAARREHRIVHSMISSPDR